MAHVGYLAPSTNFDAIVHSVFAHACNVAGPSGLLTIAAHAVADGPTVWRLASDPPDLRRLFRRGERLHRRYATATVGDVFLDLSKAAAWHGGRRPPRAGRAMADNLGIAEAALERRRRGCPSVIDREAAPWLCSLAEACRDFDIARATAEIDRLVGKGEGLTPAGDDAIVGFLAAIGALAGSDAQQVVFVDALSAAVAARAARTTDISAHYLRLAAGGHFNADVMHLVHALMGGGGRDGAAVPAIDATADSPLDPALEAALNVGATSGADMVAGMIAGFRASRPANA